jgi:hypothetical protein
MMVLSARCLGVPHGSYDPEVDEEQGSDELSALRPGMPFL